MRVVVAADQVDDHLERTSGLPRQFCEMKLNRRCSILFHLLVPGGKWQTTTSPVSSARLLQLGLPESGAVAVRAAAVGRDRQRLGVGVALWPSCSHQARIEATENWAVSGRSRR